MRGVKIKIIEDVSYFVECPGCGKTIRVKEDRSIKVKCKVCGEKFVAMSFVDWGKNIVYD